MAGRSVGAISDCGGEQTDKKEEQEGGETHTHTAEFECGSLDRAAVAGACRSTSEAAVAAETA